MSRRPRESDLRSPDPERFGDAAVLCQHRGAFCLSDGYCHYGDCFTRERAQKRLAAWMAKVDERLANLERWASETTTELNKELAEGREHRRRIRELMSEEQS